VITWLRGLWYARLRRIDLEILWPVCCEQADTLDHAKAAFAVHAYHDRAWQALGASKTFDVIDRLQPLAWKDWSSEK
jgi:hypothetical protein